MTETEFENQILAALNEIDAGRGAQLPANAWTSVLDRFARTLSRHRSIGASVEAVPQLPGGLRLVTWPKLRRDERTPMLNFASQGGALILLGQGRREFGSAEELETYLTQDFLRASAFPDTLAVYEETCAIPVRGFLRKGRPNETSLADVPIRLEPEEQRKLAEAAPGAELSVTPREDRIPLTSLFVSGQRYASLVAGGYGMWVAFADRAGQEGFLTIAGPAMREDELL
jgi:hypothetical protein